MCLLQQGYNTIYSQDCILSCKCMQLLTIKAALPSNSVKYNYVILHVSLHITNYIVTTVQWMNLICTVSKPYQLGQYT